MITKLTVTPLEGVNGISFGTNREAVRNTFGQCIEFRKSSFSKNTTDDFGTFHVFYDTDNRFNAIEVFEAEVVVNETRIFPGTVSDARKLIDDLVSDEEDYWISKKWSVGIYAPGGDIEGILFGAADYYA